VYCSIKRYCSNSLLAYINDLFTFFMPNLVSFEISLDKYCVLCHFCTLLLQLCESHCPTDYCVLLSHTHETYPLFQSPTVQCLLRDLNDHISMSPTYYKYPWLPTVHASHVLCENWGQSWALHPTSLRQMSLLRFSPSGVTKDQWQAKHWSARVPYSCITTETPPP